MSTNDFLSQFKFKRLSQSIWFNVIHVLLLLIVIVGLGIFFLYILMNIQINTISFVYFMLQNYNLFIFNTAPQAPHFFLGYTPGGAAAPSAPLLPTVMSRGANILKRTAYKHLYRSSSLSSSKVGLKNYILICLIFK